jgi:hypothetical protein
MNAKNSTQAVWWLAATAAVLAVYSMFMATPPPPKTNNSTLATTPVSAARDASDALPSDTPASGASLIGRAANLRTEIEVAVQLADPARALPLFTELAQLEAPAAADLAARLASASGNSRLPILQAVSGEWAATSPEQALAWAARLDAAEERQLVREYICQRVAQRDPATALTLAAQAGFGPESTLVAELTQQWTAQDGAAATQWALRQPAGPARDQLLARVALILAEKAPAQAGQLVVDEITAGPAQEESTISVLHQWAIRDLPGAEQWVAQFPPGPLRERAEHELAGVAAKRGE